MPPATLPAALGPILDFLDMAGIAVFALSGALLAAVKKQTLVTFLFFAVVTGVGGGTVRDLLIGAPVFWVHENVTLLICFGAALRGLAAAGAALEGQDPALARRRRPRRLRDLRRGQGRSPSASRRCPPSRMGVLTGCLGGIVRDVLAGEPSILMRPELYVTVAALSAALLVGLTLAGRAGRRRRPDRRRSPASRCAARAILRGWALPAYRR